MNDHEEFRLSIGRFYIQNLSRGRLVSLDHNTVLQFILLLG